VASVDTVTVLITDLVGSTALGSRVGPTVADALRREHFGVLREAIEASQGREVKNLGDGLMVVFASASGGLGCAVAMQQAMERRNRFAEQPLHVRIGVGAGEATVEDGDYFGMPPIEAARLCDQAGGDGILASSLARWIAARHDGLSFDSVGMLELKGIPGPVEAFQVGWEPLAEVGLPDRLTGVPEVSFVGREVERERLAQGWQAARAGRRQVVMVSGEPGIGKTRLATHAALRAHADGATVLYGRCDEDLGVAYQPWLEALRHYVSNGPKAVLREHVAANGGDVARLAPELGRRLDDVPAPQDSDPETERYLLFNAVLGLLQAAADRSPVVLVLDDLQWADRPTLVLLRHVIDHSAEVPLLIVGAFRASELSNTDPLTALLADLRREDDTVSRLALDGLGQTEIVALLESVAGHELDEPGLALAAELRRETDGNPFFVGELLRNLRETGAIAQDSEGRWAVQREASKLGLPESVREVIGRRVGRLGEETRQTLAGAAVIGRDFELELLAAMSGEDEDLVLDRLDGAQAASLIVERAGQPGWFSFSHALVEHTLYEELGATRRARLHRRIAEALERQVGGDPGERIGELAHHWGQAVAPVALSKAADYAERAGRRALEQLAPDEAQRWFEQALELRAGQPESDAHRELLVLLGDAQRQAGDAGYRGTLLRAARLAEQAGDVDRQARAVLATWRGTSSLGQRDDDLVTALEAAAEALPTEDPRRAAVLSQLAAELTFSAPLERRRALADEALTIARAAGDPRLLCDVLMHHTYATWVPHAIAELAPYLKEALAIADEIGDPWLRFRAAHRACFVLEAGDLDGFDACIALHGRSSAGHTAAARAVDPALPSVATRVARRAPGGGRGPGDARARGLRRQRRRHHRLRRPTLQRPLGTGPPARALRPHRTGRDRQPRNCRCSACRTGWRCAALVTTSRLGSCSTTLRRTASPRPRSTGRGARRSPVGATSRSSSARAKPPLPCTNYCYLTGT
jgi:class 3 adenylate cyclase